MGIAGGFVDINSRSFTGIRSDWGVIGGRWK